MVQLVSGFFILLLGTSTHQILGLSSLHPPFRCTRTLMNFPLSLFQAQQPALSLKFLLHFLLQPLHLLGSCLGALQVCSPVSCIRESRIRVQYTRGGLTNAEEQWTITCLDLQVTLLAIFTTKEQCWFFLSLFRSPGSFSARLLPICSFSSCACAGGCAFPSAELCTSLC